MNSYDPAFLQIVNDYNRNMREYNRNMRTVLQRADSSNYASAVGLTIAQLESATDIVIYDNNVHADMRCPISLEDFTECDILCKIKHCNHIFKRSHLILWLQTHVTCPSCRHNLIGIPTPPNSDSEQDDDISRLLTSLMTDVSGNNISQYIFEFPFRRSS